jgi:hypothetical protein
MEDAFSFAEIEGGGLLAAGERSRAEFIMEVGL